MRISMTLESKKLDPETMNSHFSNPTLHFSPFRWQWHSNDLHHKYVLKVSATRWRAQRKVIDSSGWPSFTPPTVWKKAKETEEGCGHWDVTKGRQWDSLRETKGRQGERGRPAERQEEKRRWFGCQLLVHDDLLSRHDTADTDKEHLLLLDYSFPHNTKEVACKPLQWPLYIYSMRKSKTCKDPICCGIQQICAACHGVSRLPSMCLVSVCRSFG